MSEETSIDEAVHHLTHRDEFAHPLDSMSVEAKVEAYAALHFIEEVTKHRREGVREDLLVITEKNGTLTEKGGYRMEVGGHTVLREKRTASAPDEKLVLALLEKAGLPVTAAFDKVSVLQPNPSKINALVETGHLSEEDAAKLYKVTWALVVKPSEQMEALLENAVPPPVLPTKKKRR
jgi:hypothetical protein